MPKSAHPLDDISIKSPCSADWDSMVGNDVVRFCHHCDLNVHDLSLMTREEALSLVRNSKGRLCLRYLRREDGTIQTAPPFQKLHVIKRRASRLVAGAFGATLSICASVAAQTPSVEDVPEAEICEKPLRAPISYTQVEGGSAVLTGTVADPNDAVIARANVKLTNEATGNVISVETNDEGQYRFSSLAGGSYTLEIQSLGFALKKLEGVRVMPSIEQKLNFTLEPAGVTSGAVMVVIESKEPLIRAVMENDVKEVSKLLIAGADVNVLDDNYGATPLMEAVTQGNKEMVSLLLKAEADVNAKTGRGRSAMLALTDSTTVEVLREILEAGAQVDDADNEGFTPLMLAASLEKSALVKALIEAGAKLDKQNAAGQTALMLAAREGHIENVRALLEAGADPSLKDEDGWTALRYAEDNERADVENLLRPYGPSQWDTVADK